MLVTSYSVQLRYISDGVGVAGAVVVTAIDVGLLEEVVSHEGICRDAVKLQHCKVVLCVWAEHNKGVGKQQGRSND